MLIPAAEMALSVFERSTLCAFEIDVVLRVACACCFLVLVATGTVSCKCLKPRYWGYMGLSGRVYSCRRV